MITFPEATKKIPPKYPRNARRDQVSGKAILSIVVCRDGSVGDVQPLKAPSKELGEAAAKAVKQWAYKPATRDGESVAVYLTVSVDFTLTP